MDREFNILKCDHTGIVVESLKDALAFWTGVMGATVERTFTSSGDRLGNVTGAVGAEVDVALIVIAGGQRIELLEYRDIPAKTDDVLRPFDAGAMHLSLNVDDVYAAIRMVEPYGFKAQGVPQHSSTGAISMYVVGPRGLALELRQPLT